MGIRAADLLIDEENPRISQPNIGQHKALQALAQHLQRKVQALAAHIVRHGTLYLLADAKRVAKALMYIVNDLVSGQTRVGNVYTKEQRIKYANNLPNEIAVTPTVKSGHGVAANTGSKSRDTKIG